MKEILLPIVKIIIGPIMDIIYFSLFIIISKKITEKRFLLAICIAVIYIICVMISKYNAFYYLMFYFLCFGVLKLLYKEKAQLADIFLVLFISLYLSLLSFIVFYFVKEDYSNYYQMAVINKILLFLPLLVKDKICLGYEKYCKLWNRNDKEKRFIKSITLRNISLIVLNCFLFISNLIFIYIKTL